MVGRKIQSGQCLLGSKNKYEWVPSMAVFLLFFRSLDINRTVSRIKHVSKSFGVILKKTAAIVLRSCLPRQLISGPSVSEQPISRIVSVFFCTRTISALGGRGRGRGERSGRGWEGVALHSSKK